MIKVTLITLGKLKEKYLRDAVDEYAKRLSRYCALEMAEINPVSLPENPSEKEIAAALLKEKEMIFKKIPENAKVFALCVEGKQKSSEDFADEIRELTNEGQSFCFILGSSYGLNEDVKRRADIKLSLSKMTFPHQLFRVMLLEQLYRGFKIIEGSTYHK